MKGALAATGRWGQGRGQNSEGRVTALPLCAWSRGTKCAFTSGTRAEAPGELGSSVSLPQRRPLGSQRKPASSFSSNTSRVNWHSGPGWCGHHWPERPGAGVGCGLLLPLPRGGQSGRDTRIVQGPSPETLLTPGLKRTFHLHPGRGAVLWRRPGGRSGQLKEASGRGGDSHGSSAGSPRRPRPFPALGSPPHPRSRRRTLPSPRCCPHASATPCPPCDLTPLPLPARSSGHSSNVTSSARPAWPPPSPSRALPVHPTPCTIASFLGSLSLLHEKPRGWVGSGPRAGASGWLVHSHA